MLRDPGFALFIALLFLVQLFGTAYYARGPLYLLGSAVSKEGLSSLMSIGQATEVSSSFCCRGSTAASGPRGPWRSASGPGRSASGSGPGGSFASWWRGRAPRHLLRLRPDRGDDLRRPVCPRDARASAQSLLSLLVDGSGAFLGNFLIGAVVTRYTVAEIPDWRSIWLVPTAGFMVVLLGFLLGFRAQHRAPEPAVIPEK